jgi:hypothetical protein
MHQKKSILFVLLTLTLLMFTLMSCDLSSSDGGDNLVEREMTVTPSSLTDGETATDYDFVITLTGFDSSITSIDVDWNFGDGSSDATGSYTLTNTGSCCSYSIIITHSYSSESMFGLTVSASDGTDVLETAYASVTIGTVVPRPPETLSVLDQWTAADSGGYGLTVDNWDVSVLPAGALIDIDYDAYSMPDKFIIEYPIGTVVYNSGWRGDSSYDGSSTYPGGVVSPGYNQVDGLFSVINGVDSFKITTIGGESGTAWEYSMRARN